MQAALTAPGAAADLDRSRRAVGHSEQRGRNVERFDLSPSAAVRAVRIRLAHLAENFAWGPDQGRDQAQGVDGEIIQGAVAGPRLAAPGKGRLGIGHEVLVHFEAKMGEQADRVALEKLVDEADGRTLDVIIAEYGDAAGGARRRRHALGLVERRRHRLFAPHMLASFERRDRHRGVQGVGGGDRNDFHARVRDQRAPVVGRGFEAELVGFPTRQPFFDLAEHDAPDDRRVVEDRVDARPGQCMAFAHVASADESHADCAHRSPRFWRPDLALANTNISYATQIGISVLFVSVSAG